MKIIKYPGVLVNKNRIQPQNLEENQPTEVGLVYSETQS